MYDCTLRHYITSGFRNLQSTINNLKLDSSVVSVVKLSLGYAFIEFFAYK
jgi:hypothetical protein